MGASRVDRCPSPGDRQRPLWIPYLNVGFFQFGKLSVFRPLFLDAFKVGLAHALAKIISSRSKQSNFQLITITHDEVSHSKSDHRHQQQFRASIIAVLFASMRASLCTVLIMGVSVSISKNLLWQKLLSRSRPRATS